MGSEGNGGYSQPAIPQFDGDYDHWSKAMENLLRYKECWIVVESGFTQPGVNDILTPTQKKILKEMQFKDWKAKNYLFQSLDKSILKTITKKETSKQFWDSMKMKCQGNGRVQRAQLNRLRREFEILAMKQGESVNDYFGRVMVIATDMRNSGETMTDVKIIEKILRTLTERWNYIVGSIEESKDIDTLSVDALQSSLLVHEQKFRKEDEEHALVASYNEDKATVECYKCHNLGHYQYECPNETKQANYMEMKEAEEMLLMAYLDGTNNNNLWFLDSGCSNHMCGDSSLFSDLENNYGRKVTLGNHMQMEVVGKGSVRLVFEGVCHVVNDVLYVPDLKNNLLSLGQLQEKGLSILIKNNQCRIYHPTKGLIVHTNMTSNRMFVLISSQGAHRRYGHLGYMGLKTLQSKGMVRGLPNWIIKSKICIPFIQHFRPFQRFKRSL